MWPCSDCRYMWFQICCINAYSRYFFSQAEWVALNYVPFAERSLEVVVDLYQKTACHKAVINEKVLQNIIKVVLELDSRISPSVCVRVLCNVLLPFFLF